MVVWPLRALHFAVLIFILRFARSFIRLLWASIANMMKVSYFLAMSWTFLLVCHDGVLISLTAITMLDCFFLQIDDVFFRNIVRFFESFWRGQLVLELLLIIFRFVDKSIDRSPPGVNLRLINASILSSGFVMFIPRRIIVLFLSLFIDFTIIFSFFSWSFLF